MNHEEVRRQITPLERARRTDARAHGGRADEEHDHRAERCEVHGINAGDAVLQEAAIAKALQLQALQIDVRQDEAREREKQVDPQIAVRHQTELTHAEAQMVLEMVQKHPERRQKA